MRPAGELVQNDITRYGLRRAHVMRFGRCPDREGWVEQLVPGDSLETLACMEQTEEELGMHHLRLWWNAREMVLLPEQVCPGRWSAFWWIGAGETLRQAADLAAWLYQLRTGQRPSRAMVARLPQGATECIEVEGRGRTDFTLELCAAGWAPQRYVIVA